MKQQITWTHVDQLVRKMHDEKGMLQTGDNDAEVTYNLVKWLEKENKDLSLIADRLRENLHWAEQSLKALQSQPTGKTKKRLAALEAKVEELVLWTGLER